MDTDLHYQWSNHPPYSEVTINQGAVCDTVTYTNRLTSYSDTLIEFVLSGHTFVVVQGDGNQPDKLFTTAAIGWISPEPLSLGEGETGTVQICPMGLS